MNRRNLLYAFVILSLAGFVLILLPQNSIVPVAYAQSGAMTVNISPSDPTDENYRAPATGFSVSAVLNPTTGAPDEYRVWATAGFQQTKWTTNGVGRRDLYIETSGWPLSGTYGINDGNGIGRDDCAHTKDPRLWDFRCGDSLGYMWKKTACPPGGGVACGNNNYWNAWPGLYNITSQMTFGIWPKSNDFGTTGYTPIINGSVLNGVALRGETPAAACEAPGVRQPVDEIWVDDALPFNAVAAAPTSPPAGADKVEAWTWVNNPAPPMNGSALVHRSPLYDGVHEHWFKSTNEQLPINNGDVLIAYVYLENAFLPNEIMLQWWDGASWDHRAYWGANNINQGTNNTSSRLYMGALPSQRGSWFRLEVSAAAVGLTPGQFVSGMRFSLHGGRAHWEYAGKYVPLKGSTSCPPKTGGGCSVYNQYDFATGAANSKVVQYKYANGSTRWFMMFNKMVHVINRDTRGLVPLDTWQVLWATSTDGGTWNIHPQILFRTTGEASNTGANCGSGGLLMTDMIIDDGYYYAVFQDLLKPWSYLVRSPVSTDPNSSTGYGSWEVAGEPSTPGGDYVWKSMAPLGKRYDFEAMGAHKLMMTRNSFIWGGVKQASIARMFASATPNSRSRYIGITNDFAPDAKVQIWSTQSLSKPFTYQSDVVLPANMPTAEQNGWEATFVHYVDNSSASPRIFATGFELWFTERDRGLLRHRATLSNF